MNLRGGEHSLLVCCNMVQRAGRMVWCGGARAGLSVVVKRRPGGKRRPDVGLTEVQ